MEEKNKKEGRQEGGMRHRQEENLYSPRATRMLELLSATDSGLKNYWVAGVLQISMKKVYFWVYY